MDTLYFILFFVLSDWDSDTNESLFGGYYTDVDPTYMSDGSELMAVYEDLINAESNKVSSLNIILDITPIDNVIETTPNNYSSV